MDIKMSSRTHAHIKFQYLIHIITISIFLGVPMRISIDAAIIIRMLILVVDDE